MARHTVKPMAASTLSIVTRRHHRQKPIILTEAPRRLSLAWKPGCRRRMHADTFLPVTVKAVNSQLIGHWYSGVYPHRRTRANLHNVDDAAAPHDRRNCSRFDRR